MATQKKHPHKLKPSKEEMWELLTQLRKDDDPTILDTYMSVHQFIINTLPEISYSMDLKDGAMGYGAKQYGYDGWGMVALGHHKSWINLHFMKGAQLTEFDQMGILEGKGKQLRHITFSSPEEVKKAELELKNLLLQASNLMNTNG